ncbi:hypothetical protein ABPG72_013948 [Tetrahymena utriculariae]
MSKYSRALDNGYWVKRQRAQSIQSAKQIENMQNTLNQGYSVALQFNGDHKREKSADIFNENRISTCSFVKRKGNDYEAVPFYARPLTAANLASTAETIMNKSLYKTSTNTDAYRTRALSHAGMGSSKPLEPYNPNAQRSRLPSQDFKQYYVNRSVIEIGDRNSFDKKHYLTTNRNEMGRQPHKNFVSKHPGITTYQIKWDKYLKQK